VIIMVDVQGLDYGEASQAIGKPIGTVKSRLSRGRARVQDCLSNVRELLPSSIRLVSEGIL
jgi:RNA polymerase sigma-70 factor (ECF subfamily)